MDVELKSAVERLTEWVGEPDRFEIQFATDLRTVLGSLQAPCPGEAGEPSRYHLCGPTVTLDTADGLKTFGTGWLLISEAEYALLSAQSVPGGDHVGRVN